MIRLKKRNENVCWTSPKRVKEKERDESSNILSLILYGHSSMLSLSPSFPLFCSPLLLRYLYLVLFLFHILLYSLHYLFWLSCYLCLVTESAAICGDMLLYLLAPCNTILLCCYVYPHICFLSSWFFLPLMVLDVEDIKRNQKHIARRYPFFSAASNIFSSLPLRRLPRPSAVHHPLRFLFFCFCFCFDYLYTSELS